MGTVVKKWIIRALAHGPNITKELLDELKSSKPYTREELMGINMEYSIKAAGGFGKGPAVKAIHDAKHGNGFRIRFYCRHTEDHYGQITKSEAELLRRGKCSRCNPSC